MLLILFLCFLKGSLQLFKHCRTWLRFESINHLMKPSYLFLKQLLLLEHHTFVWLNHKHLLSQLIPILCQTCFYLFLLNLWFFQFRWHLLQLQTEISFTLKRLFKQLFDTIFRFMCLFKLYCETLIILQKLIYVFGWINFNS